jgi:hypothetical protein
MNRKSRMKEANTALAAIGGITLFAILSVAPGTADARRYHAGAHWRHGPTSPSATVYAAASVTDSVAISVRGAAISASSRVATSVSA